MCFKVVDFFCGAGGFSEGFHQAGFEIIKAFDIWGPAIETHNMNHFSEIPIAEFGDVYELSLLPDEEFNRIIPDSEVIIGSPPCVAFSNSNKSGKGDKELGVRLVESYLRIIARKKFKEDSILKYWILENVENVEEYIKPVYTMVDLELDLPNNYILNVKNENSRVYNMVEFGVPSSRKRFICGEYPTPMTTAVNERKTLRMVLDSLGSPTDYKERMIYDINFHLRLSSTELTDHFYYKEIAEYEWKKAKRQKQDKGYMGRMSFPENLDKPARTIMATMSSSSRESMIFSLNGLNRYRYPTIREIASAMSYPIDYRFYGKTDTIKYKLVGNSVPPLFSLSLAKAILVKERKEVKLKTTPRNFCNDIEFINLNGMCYDLKIEKVKKWSTKFKYHVPYLILDAYRVELQNQFLEGDVRWKVEIHKSQGKNAKIYQLEEMDLDFVEEKKLDYINDEIKKIVKSINHKKLQELYCQTSKQRAIDNSMGPEELLYHVRNTIDENFNEYTGSIYVPTLGLDLPKKILIANNILNSIICHFDGREK